VIVVVVGHFNPEPETTTTTSTSTSTTTTFNSRSFGHLRSMLFSPLSMAYLDNAASTPVAPEVRDALLRATDELYANPASAHGPGAAATRALEAARTEVAALLRAAPAEIHFTSGGTEADALGVLGAAGAARGRHIVVTAIEHPAVLRNAELLAARGFTLTVVPPEPTGCVAVERVVAAVGPDTAVLAVMLVNNELGTIQPVAEMARALRAAGCKAHLHVDAVQAAGLVPIDVRGLGADSVALSAHKIHGPKGAGALWLRPGARCAPVWDGGRQERGVRSGTENLPACVAFGKAAALCRSADPAALGSLRDDLEARIFELIPEARPTVTGGPRAPHIASVLLPDLPAEPILHALEARGVIASAGSACASRTRGPSHVLAAVGVGERAAVLRFSLSRFTTADEVAGAAAALREAVEEIRPVARQARGRRS
jgi:cysteine desulfurase